MVRSRPLTGRHTEIAPLEGFLGATFTSSRANRDELLAQRQIAPGYSDPMAKFGIVKEGLRYVLKMLRRSTDQMQSNPCALGERTSA
jgi:hypothetical protein